MWTFQAQSQINSQVERYGDYIIFVGDSDAVYFLSPDGKEQFILDNPGWSHYTFLMADDVMYYGTGPRVDLIGPYDINKREFLWYLAYHQINAIWYSFTAIRGDLLYIGTVDFYDNMYFGFYAFNRHNGEIVWEQRREGNIVYMDYAYTLFMRNVNKLDFMAPTVWKDLVIFTGGDRSARAFDAKTGAMRWEQVYDIPISSAPTVAAGRVYFGLEGDNYIPSKLVCISALDGKLLWEMETEGCLLSAPVIAGKRIIFGTDKNVFYVLEQVL